MSFQAAKLECRCFTLKTLRPRSRWESGLGGDCKRLANSNEKNKEATGFAHDIWSALWSVFFLKFRDRSLNPQALVASTSRKAPIEPDWMQSFLHLQSTQNWWLWLANVMTFASAASVMKLKAVKPLSQFYHQTLALTDTQGDLALGNKTTQLSPNVLSWFFFFGSRNKLSLVSRARFLWWHHVCNWRFCWKLRLVST